MTGMESKMNRRAAFAAWLLAATLGVSVASVAGVQEIVRETQRTVENNGQVTLVWWMPQQFWEESMNANPSVSPEARAQVLATLADYTILALMRANVGALGIADAVPKAELVKNARVKVDGKLIESLPPEQISPAAQLLLGQLKPALASMVGQVGQSLEFVVYPGKVDGRLLLDAARPGTFEVQLFDQTKAWRLPLGSLLPPRTDRKTGEQFPGNYNFNPYTGDKLPAP